MHFGHPYSTPQSLSVCLRLACNGGLPRIRHSARIYWATEVLRNLDESDMCEHASVSLWFYVLLLHLWMLFFPSIFLFQFPFPLLFPGKSCCPQESLPGWTAAQKTSWPEPHEAVWLSHAITCLWINLFMFRVKGGFSSTASLIMTLWHFNQ